MARMAEIVVNPYESHGPPASVALREEETDCSFRVTVDPAATGRTAGTWSPAAVSATSIRTRRAILATSRWRVAGCRLRGSKSTHLADSKA